MRAEGGLRSRGGSGPGPRGVEKGEGEGGLNESRAEAGPRPPARFRGAPGGCRGGPAPPEAAAPGPGRTFPPRGPAWAALSPAAGWRLVAAAGPVPPGAPAPRAAPGPASPRPRGPVGVPTFAPLFLPHVARFRLTSCGLSSFLSPSHPAFVTHNNSGGRGSRASPRRRVCLL